LAGFATAAGNALIGRSSSTWVNTMPTVLQVMLRRHVWMNPALLTAGANI